MFGELDYAKVLLRCIGCYISWSGLDDVLIKAKVSGKRTLISILTGSRYCRSVQSMLMTVEVIDTLICKICFLATDSQIKHDLMSCRCFLARRMLSYTLPIHAGPFTHAAIAYQVHVPD